MIGLENKTLHSARLEYRLLRENDKERLSELLMIDDKEINISELVEEIMKYKGTLVVVKDCGHALKFYQDMFGLQLLHDNDGNMELAGGLYLQEAQYWEMFLQKSITSRSNSTELYFEEADIEAFVEKLQKLYPETEFVNQLMTHSWGQRVVRFYDPDGNLIEVGTPV